MNTPQRKRRANLDEEAVREEDGVYVWRLKRGAGILGGARNVTAHSLTGRRRRRCVSHATRTTRSVLSRLPPRARCDAHTRASSYVSRVISRAFGEIRVNSAPPAILSPHPPRSGNFTLPPFPEWRSRSDFVEAQCLLACLFGGTCGS